MSIDHDKINILQCGGQPRSHDSRIKSDLLEAATQLQHTSQSFGTVHA